jgi:hypothetical protein
MLELIYSQMLIYILRRNPRTPKHRSEIILLSRKVSKKIMYKHKVSKKFEIKYEFIHVENLRIKFSLTFLSQFQSAVSIMRMSWMAGSLEFKQR